MGLEKVDSWGDIPDYTMYIQHKGIFDMQDIYQTAVDFLRAQKFKIREKLHFQKRATAFGIENKIMLEARRRSEEYYEFFVDLYLHTFDMTEVEVKMPDGSSKTYNKGRIWIEIRGKCFVDPDRRWGNNIFIQQLKSWYHKYVIQKKAEAIWWDEMHYKITLKLRNILQQRLKQESEEFEARYFAGVH